MPSLDDTPTDAIAIDYAALARSIKQWAGELGFSDAGISGVDLTRDEQHLTRGRSVDVRAPPVRGAPSP